MASTPIDMINIDNGPVGPASRTSTRTSTSVRYVRYDGHAPTRIHFDRRQESPTGGTFTRAEIRVPVGRSCFDGYAFWHHSNNRQLRGHHHRGSLSAFSTATTRSTAAPPPTPCSAATKAATLTPAAAAATPSSWPPEPRPSRDFRHDRRDGHDHRPRQHPDRFVDPEPARYDLSSINEFIINDGLTVQLNSSQIGTGAGVSANATILSAFGAGLLVISMNTGALNLAGFTVTGDVTVSILGTNADEAITGTNGKDILTPGNGNDTVNGLGGNDTFNVIGARLAVRCVQRRRRQRHAQDLRRHGLHAERLQRGIAGDRGLGGERPGPRSATATPTSSTSPASPA